MKTKIIRPLLLASGLALMAGCVDIPPLIHVENKSDNRGDEIMKRLDSIDQRLNEMQRQLDHKQEKP